MLRERQQTPSFLSASRDTANALRSITPPLPRGARSKNPKMIQYTTSDRNFSNNTNSFNNVWKIRSIPDDESQLLACLSPLEPKKQHGNIREHHMDYIGEWHTGTEEFRSWQGEVCVWNMKVTVESHWLLKSRDWRKIY